MTWTSWNPAWHQLPSTSPVDASSLWAASLGAVRGSDERQALRAVLREEHSVAQAVLTGSGTEALTLALLAAQELSGKPATLALPAYSCYDVAAAAVRIGRPLVFYDVDLRSLGPDPGSLRSALEAGATIVVLGVLYGFPLDWDVIDPVLKGSNAIVIEDAAQGHGARWRGKPLGGHGRLGVLSFGRGKGWTGGSGGAVLVRDADDVGAVQPLLSGDRAGLTREIRALGQATAHWLLGRPSVYRVPRSLPMLKLGETTYRPAGEPCGMPRAAAALALASRGKAVAAAERRKEVAEGYRSRLSGAGGLHLFCEPDGGEAGYIRFPLLAPEGIASFPDPRHASRLGAAPGYPRPLPELPQTRPLMREDARHGRWEGARRLAAELITLPTHEGATEANRDALTTLLGTVSVRGRGGPH